jgi:hypothetical protein
MSKHIKENDIFMFKKACKSGLFVTKYIKMHTLVVSTLFFIGVAGIGMYGPDLPWILI